MIEIAIFGGIIAVYIGSGIVMEIKQDKRHKRVLKMNEQNVEKNQKLIEVIQELQIDPIEIKSLKRWLKATIDQVQQLEEKLDKLNNPEPIVFKPKEPFDLDEYIKEINKGTLFVTDDGREVEVITPVEIMEKAMEEVEK